MLAVGVSLQVLQQLCGMNAFMYFGPTIFKAAKLDPLLFQTINAGVNFLATFPAILLIDSYGRCALLSCGALGMMLACLVMGSVGLYAGASTASIDQNGSIIVMAMSFFFVVNFAYSWGPAVWVYVAEMFPLKHRGRCLGLTTMSNWVGNYFIAQFTPVMLQTMGFNTFFIFAFFCGLCLALARWLPETKGLVLERIGEVFAEKFGIEDGEHSEIKQASKNQAYGSADSSWRLTSSQT